MTTPSVARNGSWTFRPVRDGAATADPGDLVDILDTIDIPIVVILRNFTIACFNRAAAEVLRLAPSAIGSSPRDNSMLTGLLELEERCAEVTDTGAPFRLDFRYDDKSFTLRIAPYTKKDRQIVGTVLTFTNVTAFRASIDQAIYEREHTKAILNTVAEPLVVLSSDRKVQSANRAFYEMFHLSREEAQGAPLDQIGDRAFDIPRLHAQLEGIAATNRAFEPFEIDCHSTGIGNRTLMLDAHQLLVPRYSGRMILLALQDTTKRKQAEAANFRLAAIVESSDDAIISNDLDGVMTSWNEGAERLFWYAADEMIGKPVTVLIPPERQDEEPSILERIRRGQHVEQFETVRLRKHGSPIEISLTVSPIRNARGAIIAASKIARDITDRKRAQENEALLFDEMKHRIKNTLATVQAIATQTLKGSAPHELASFTARLHALAAAHDLLTTESWNRASLRESVGRALKPFQDTHHDRLIIEGPEVSLDAQRSMLLTLAFHELATNAVKYGALSNGTGRVRIWWEIDAKLQPRALRLHWQESGGPPVHMPDRKGFGSRLIEQVVGAQTNGSRLEFAPLGLVCSFELPLERQRSPELQRASR